MFRWYCLRGLASWWLEVGLLHMMLLRACTTSGHGQVNGCISAPWCVVRSAVPSGKGWGALPVLMNDAVEGCTLEAIYSSMWAGDARRWYVHCLRQPRGSIGLSGRCAGDVSGEALRHTSSPCASSSTMVGN